MKYLCIYCGRREEEHNAKGKFCPLGRKQKVMGHTSYHREQTYFPNEKKPIKDERFVI